MSSYDAWLEKPYRDAAENDAFCEAAVAAYAAHYDMEEWEVDEETAFEWYRDEMAAAEEEAAISRWEAEQEDREFYGYDD